MKRGLFVTGTDTGVGKTFVAAGLAAAFRKERVSIGVMKPVETGCRKRRGQRIPQDGLFLMKMAGSADSIEEVVPYRLSAPLAPRVAAELEGVEIRLACIERAYRRIASHVSVMLVEGAGGLLVPLTRKLYMVDLVERLGLPVLLVARAGLGTLNHTLLSLSCLAERGIPVAGIVLNDADGMRDPSKRSNPEILREACRIPILGQIPHAKALRMASSHADAAASWVGRRICIAEVLRRIDSAEPPRLSGPSLFFNGAWTENEHR